MNTLSKFTADRPSRAAGGCCCVAVDDHVLPFVDIAKFHFLVAALRKVADGPAPYNEEPSDIVSDSDGKKTP